MTFQTMSIHDRGSVVFFYLGIILLAIGLSRYARCTSFLSRSATAATGVAKRALITSAHSLTCHA